MERTLLLPNGGVIDESFPSFGEIDGMNDWQKVQLERFEDVALRGVNVNLTGALFRRGHFLEFGLAKSVFCETFVDDCQMILSRFSDTEVRDVTFTSVNLSHSRFDACQVSSVTVTGGSVAGCSFTSCTVEDVLITGGADAAKLSFHDCSVFLLHDAPFQGNLTFRNCVGRVCFTARSLPSRLFNKSEEVDYFLVEPTDIQRLRPHWNQRGVVTLDRDVGPSKLRRLDVAAQSVVNAVELVKAGC